MEEGGWVLRTLVALAGISALAWVVLSLAARARALHGGARGPLGFGPRRLAKWTIARLLRARTPQALPRLRVLERISLSSRQELFLVQADSRVFLLGASGGGPVALVAELDRETGLKATADSIRVN